MRLRYQALVLVGLTCAHAARADNVSDDIAKAGAAWQAHNASGTLAALNAATSAVHQIRAKALEAALPLPLPGWTADPVQTSALGADMLGGATGVSRTYHNGSQRVEVQITTDSPMLQNMAALLSSPYAQAAGAKTVTIDGHSVTYTATDNSYMTLVADKVIVKVAGNEDTPEPVLRTFVAAVDFDDAAKLAH
jgi:hypothetical protein